MRNFKLNLKYVSMAAVGLALSLSSCQNDRSLTEDASNATAKNNKSSKLNKLTSKSSARTSSFTASNYLNDLATFRPDLSQAEIDKQVKAGADAKLPSSWFLPRPNAGDQSDRSNCTGWAASYCGLSSLLYSFHPVVKHMPNNADKWHAAARSYSYPYFYAKEKGKPDNGAMMEDILNVLVNRGSMSLLARPTSNPTAVPSAQEEKDALEYRLGSWKEIKADAKLMKFFLSKNYPILVSLMAGAGMDELKTAGTGATLSNFEIDESENSDDTPHAVCIVGYDKNKGFLIQNSWGKSFGENGRFWLKDEDVDFLGELYVMFPKLN